MFDAAHLAQLVWTLIYVLVGVIVFGLAFLAVTKVCPFSVQKEIDFLMRKGMKALEEAYQPHGFNLGINIGRYSGAGIPEHLHWHIVPRWKGDTNFLPVVGESRSISEHLKTTYERLDRALKGQTK